MNAAFKGSQAGRVVRLGLEGKPGRRFRRGGEKKTNKRGSLLQKLPTNMNAAKPKITQCQRFILALRGHNMREKKRRKEQRESEKKKTTNLSRRILVGHGVICFA